MLRRALVLFAGVLLAMSFVWVSAAVAACNEVVKCDPNGRCKIEVVCDPGSGGSIPASGGSAGPAKCFLTSTQKEVPCHDPTYGWWSQPDECYYKLLEPQPPKTDSLWQGHADGAIYRSFCPWAVGRGTPIGTEWRQTPPRGFGGVLISPAELAQRAVSAMQLHAVDIGIVPEPKPGSIGLVGMPTWMWTTPTPNTWGPITRTASAGGVTVTATAKVTTAVWRMGDGTTVNCTSPGTPYQDAYGRRDSPDCGHTYTRTSLGKPGDAYQVQATSYWTVDWAGGGQTGTISLDFTAATQIRMGEMQVLITKN